MRNLLKNTLVIILVLLLPTSLSSCETHTVSQDDVNNEAAYNDADISNTDTSKFSANKTDDLQSPIASTASSKSPESQSVKPIEKGQDNQLPQTTLSSNSENISDKSTADSADVQDEPDVTQEDANTQSNKCEFVINCETAIMSDKLSDAMRNILPRNGIILSLEELEFFDGETVFDVLERVTRENNIPIEFTMTPGFGSRYIEGINSLREMDCGKDSGWLYKVNGIFPNYGCDKYRVNTGDDIGFYYTLSRGDDLK